MRRIRNKLNSHIENWKNSKKNNLAKIDELDAKILAIKAEQSLCRSNISICDKKLSMLKTSLRALDED
jgi:chromosome segregation ATPase